MSVLKDFANSVLFQCLVLSSWFSLLSYYVMLFFSGLFFFWLFFSTFALFFVLGFVLDNPSYRNGSQYKLLIESAKNIYNSKNKS